jgi:hypothetical protein
MTRATADHDGGGAPGEGMRMGFRSGLTVLLCGICMLLAASAAQATETVTITHAAFTPNLRGQPTVAIGNAVISSTLGPVPPPITHVNVFGPAGVTLELKGSETCTEEKLKELGPTGCPPNSKAGEGGGEGVYELGGEIVREPYTVDFFLTNNHPHHVAMAVDIIGYHPVALEVVFPAVVVNGRPPYGLGFSLNVPLIKVLPEASDASAASASLALGAKGQTYVTKVHGHRKRVRIRGIILPKTCPKSGWPVKTEFSFQDGTTAEAKTTVHCR